MKPSGHFIGIFIEFTAGVQYRHHNFGSRNAILVHLCRNTSPIITDGHRLIGMNHNVNFFTVAGKRFIN